MVQLMKSLDRRSEHESSDRRNKAPVKLEIEDSLEDEYGSSIKRSRTTSQCFQEWVSEEDVFSIPPSQYNPLDEPSPLGLKLRKSPSLLDLIQMKLSQGSKSKAGAAQSGSAASGVKKEKPSALVNAMDKLKASNFPASILKIGGWEYKSRYEGDLVAKCYFAKHKLVWEVLEGGLKSKIEIQWSDIMALKASCPEDGPSTLSVVLARQPLFFRETNPQPRKHTLWQATADFTEGQASLNRKHFLQCPQGLLGKHFEKLIQCDMRLNFLSQQPEVVLDSPYFDQRGSMFEVPVESKPQSFNQIENGMGSSISGLHDIASPSTQSSSFKLEQQDSGGVTLDNRSREAPSPSSGIDNRAMEGNGNSQTATSRGPTRNWDQIRFPGIHPSMSMSDLMNQIEKSLSEQITSSNPSSASAAAGAQNTGNVQEMLDDIAQYLLNDNNQFSAASDEKSLMTRVNSLCCLLNKDQQPVDAGEGSGSGNPLTVPVGQGFSGDNPAGRSLAPATMQRIDSYGDLLLHLPRIASLPKFLFNISEEDIDRRSS